MGVDHRRCQLLFEPYLVSRSQSEAVSHRRVNDHLISFSDRNGDKTVARSQGARYVSVRACETDLCVNRSSPYLQESRPES
jgi:hypothetical protein